MDIEKAQGMNIRAMLCLIAMVDNKFIPSNAAIDLGRACCEISYQMRRIEKYAGFPVFVWDKAKTKHSRARVVGLTAEGRSLYWSTKAFIEAIS